MPFPLEERFMHETERRLRRTLPHGYAARMCRANGGDLAVGTDSFLLHPIFDDSDRKRLARTCIDVVGETASARSRPGFPPDALVIGDNGGGDLLVLLADGKSTRFADAVYWWDHETNELNHVADSFEELPD